MSHTCRTCDFSKFPIRKTGGCHQGSQKVAYLFHSITDHYNTPGSHKVATRVATLSYYILKERVKAREVFSEKTSTGFF